MPESFRGAVAPSAPAGAGLSHPGAGQRLAPARGPGNDELVRRIGRIWTYPAGTLSTIEAGQGHRHLGGAADREGGFVSDLILTLNAGSSSIKFALFDRASPPVERARGQLEGLGARPHLIIHSEAGAPIAERETPEVADHADALAEILAVVESHVADARIPVIGHRIVHGGPAYAEPVILTPEAIAYLEALRPLAPLHQPHNMAGVAAARAAFPDAVQVACFDTAFHRAHPWVNDTFALPRRYYEKGVRRYGFHGLSYDYVAGALGRIAPHHALGRVVIAHLGNGASMTALNDGRAQGSSMGFSPLDGLPMGTRCGQLDPGVLLYMMEEEGLAASEISDLLYKRSGLLGLSGLSHDVRALEAAGTREADEALAYFVFRIRRELGAMTAVLNGLDALVFTGGIGENAVAIRARICAGLDWLGLELDETRNRGSEQVISSERSRVRAFVIPTNEEMTVAAASVRLTGQG